MEPFNALCCSTESATDTASPAVRRPIIQRPIVLSIAGSDSGGGAGIQADIRTFSRLGVFPTTVLTAITAQNLSAVQAVHGLDAALVEAQLEAVCVGYNIAAVKTGMLWSDAIVSRIGAWAQRAALPRLIVDPVMVSTSGKRLLAPEGIETLKTQLLPFAELVTPNVPEAEVLLGQTLSSADLDDAALELEREMGCAVLLKGGHRLGDPVDILSLGGKLRRWSHQRQGRFDSHGSGCTLAAAITAFRARGLDLDTAVDRAIIFLQQAFKSAVKIDTAPNARAVINIEVAEFDDQLPGPGA